MSVGWPCIEKSKAAMIKRKYNSNQVILPTLKKPNEINTTEHQAKSRLFKQNDALQIAEESYIDHKNSLSLFQQTPKKL